jgi:hypothetical protein
MGYRQPRDGRQEETGEGEGAREPFASGRSCVASQDKDKDAPSLAVAAQTDTRTNTCWPFIHNRPTHNRDADELQQR